MKVIFRTIDKSIREAVDSALKQNRQIEYIELEWWEIEELLASLHNFERPPFPIGAAYDMKPGTTVCHYYGTEIRKAA